jgi:hypothetical protein
MRYFLLALGLLVLTSCASGPERTPSELSDLIVAASREPSRPSCAEIVVDNRQFDDVVLRTERNERIGFALGLTKSTHRTCRLSVDTSFLVVDPVGQPAWQLPLPQNPLGFDRIIVVIASTRNQSHAELR